MNTDSTPLDPLKLTTQEKSLLWVLAGIQFCNILDFMILMPLGPHMRREFGIDTAQFGLMVSAYTFAGAILGLASALFIDKFARKTLLLWILAGFCMATLACALAPNYESMVVARAFAGAFGGVLGSMVMTIAVEIIPPQRRGQGMARVMSAFALSTVAGVPVGLWLANHTPVLAWRAPFAAVAVLAALFTALAFFRLPKLDAHLSVQGQGFAAVVQRIRDTLADANHQRGFALSALIMFSSFTVIPYITLFITANAKFPETMLPVMYLLGGTATLLTQPMIGKWSDRAGKLNAFRKILPLAVLPVLLMTHLGVPFFAEVSPWAVVVTSMAFFVLVSGRATPGFAIIGAGANPALRGTFMSLNSSVQSAAMGAAAFLTGHIISTDAAGLMQGFNYAGYIATVAAVLAWWLSGKIVQRG